MSCPKLLIVDDDESFAKTTKFNILALRPRGFEITTVSSAIKAFKFIKNEKFDIIISDYQMPKLNGLEFLKTLKERDDTTPFILFAGRGREEVAIEALNLGAD